MRVLAIDGNSDLCLGPDGHLAMRFGLDALTQRCEQVMRARLDEMVFHAGRGLPYFETLWNGAPNPRLFEDAARRALEGVDGVLAVESFELDADGGAVKYRAGIRTIYGEGVIGGADGL